MKGVYEIAELALISRPRYHICGCDELIENSPYLNKDLGAGASVTRFVSLASVGNKVIEAYAILRIRILRAYG